MTAVSPTRARVYLVLAAVIWSLSGAFTKLLREPTGFDLDRPLLSPIQIACFRTLLAAGMLLLFVRPRYVTVRPLVLVLAGSFAAMNVLFVSAMALGTSLETILLQYTAPLWVFLAAVWWLKEPADRRGVGAVLLGFLGVVLIVAGGWQDARLDVVAMGLGSGFLYAGIILCMRTLRDCSALWLNAACFLVSGLVLLPFVVPVEPAPTPGQWVVLFLYGAVQMAVPYFLIARALGSVSPQEAGTITLLEPILNPVWTYLVAGEVPSTWGFVGGSFILAALVWRYWPVRGAR